MGRQLHDVSSSLAQAGTSGRTEVNPLNSPFHAPTDPIRRVAVTRLLRQNNQHGPKAGGLLLLLSVLFFTYRQFSGTSPVLPAFLLARSPLPVHHELPSIDFANHPVSLHRPVRPFPCFCVFLTSSASEESIHCATTRRSISRHHDRHRNPKSPSRSTPRNLRIASTTISASVPLDYRRRLHHSCIIEDCPQRPRSLGRQDHHHSKFCRCWTSVGSE